MLDNRSMYYSTSSLLKQIAMLVPSTPERPLQQGRKIPQWLHFFARENIRLKSLLHFRQASSGLGSLRDGGGPLRSGSPRVSMVKLDG